jgi:hypothetical protein
MQSLNVAEEAIRSTPIGEEIPLTAAPDRLPWPSAVLCTFGFAASLWAGIGFVASALVN